MLKILFLIYDMSKEGGNSLQALNLAVQISSIGNEVIIVTSSLNNIILKILKKQNVRVYYPTNSTVPCNSFIKQIELLKLIDFVSSKEKVDLIQIFDPISTGIIGLYSLIKFQKPIVIRLGTVFEKFYSFKFLNILKKFNRTFIGKLAILVEKILKYFCFFILIISKSIISNCSFIKDNYKNIFYENKIYVIHNGVDIEKFIKNENNLKINDYALYVGRIEPRKNINIIINAYSNLSSETRPKKLILVGDYNFAPEYTKSLKELIEKLDLEEKIIFKGFVSQNSLYKFYNNSRYTIFSSDDRFFPMTEGLPNVVIEAMASGAVLVASNVAGVNEVIKNGENGFLYNPNSINELIELLSMLDNAKENYFKMIQNNAIKFIQENFNFKLISKKYLKIYNNIVKKE